MSYLTMLQILNRKYSKKVKRDQHHCTIQNNHKTYFLAGILYKQTQNQIHQEEGSRIFNELLDESRRFGSSQTQSKTHK